MATVDTQSSIVVYKTMPYRGGTREWSNRYHVTGPLSIGSSPFNTFADAVVADEAAVHDGSVTIVRAEWSDASTATSTNPHGIVTQSKVYTTTGGGIVGGGGRFAPGEAAAVIRYSTTQRTSKNHPIYLFNYYHRCFIENGTTDDLEAAEKTQLEEYGTDWLAGFSDGTNTRIRCGPRGAVAQARYVLPMVTHRDFPR